MVQTSVAVYRGRRIGIESVYNVIDGKTIKIEGRIESLRELAKAKELRCECGCGAFLTPVVGEVRTPHFRVLEKGNKPCDAKTETETSICSKVIIRAWFSEKTGDNTVQNRVPVSSVSKEGRRYEYSFVSINSEIAIDYCYDSVNISDEKLNALYECDNNLKIIHITDIKNSILNGQYPEKLIKIQKKQGFCLLLSASKLEYEKAKLKAVFYEKNARGLWDEIVVTDGLLREYSIDSNGEICIFGNAISGLCQKMRIEREKRLEERERKAVQAEEKSHRQAELEKEINEKNRAKEQQTFESNLRVFLEPSVEPIQGPDGNYYALCVLCRKVYREEDFSIKSIPKHYCVGACKKCDELYLSGLNTNQKFVEVKRAFKNITC